MTSTPIRAVVNVDLPGATISRHLYGHFAEHLGRCIYGGFWVGEGSDIPNEGGIRLDVVEALRALGIPNLRWPGGCFADEYHWRDGIGPRDERPRTVNSHWGDVVENNAFGTHEFMQLCEMLGAEPYVSGNVGSGTVQEMSDWVEYLTRGDDSPMARLRRENGRDEPWTVPFWGVGNEPWGCGGNMSAQTFADLARQYATYVRQHSGNSVYRIAAGASDGDYRWTQTLMEALGSVERPGDLRGVFQAISFHYYSMTGTWDRKGSATEFTVDEFYRAIAAAAKAERFIEGHSAVMDVYDPEKKIGLVLDEWGTWWDPTPGTNPGFLEQQNTLRDALVASVHFDAFHRHADRLVMANIAQTINVLQAMLLTDAETGALVLTPTYHVFEMNRGHHDARALDVHLLDDAPVRESSAGDVRTLSASASRKDGRALLSLTNAHDADAATVAIQLRGASAGDVRGRILTAAAIDAHNTFATPDAVTVTAFDGFSLDGDVLTVTIPAHAYVTIDLAVDPAD
ncbi:alpha-N-arabinofuranosidase [Microbacterium sp. NPDC055683]